MFQLHSQTSTVQYDTDTSGGLTPNDQFTDSGELRVSSLIFTSGGADSDEGLNNTDYPANDYEVTGFALDSLVQAAWDAPGSLGARMTGAGFGGCAIAIVHKNQVDDFYQNVLQSYQKMTGTKCSFYETIIESGPKKI